MFPAYNHDFGGFSVVFSVRGVCGISLGLKQPNCLVDGASPQIAKKGMKAMLQGHDASRCSFCLHRDGGLIGGLTMVLLRGWVSRLVLRWLDDRSLWCLLWSS